jgi:signal transduction histidine kinase
VLGNVLGNALRFTPPHGVVTTRARVEGAHVLVAVQDNGPGIDPANVERVFEPFFQEAADDSRRTGLGLGLFICCQLVERQGGAVSIDNAPEGGAVVSFTVPIARDDQGAAA